MNHRPAVDLFQDIVPQQRTTDYFPTNPALQNQRMYKTAVNPTKNVNVPVGLVDVLHSPAMAALKVARGQPMSGLGDPNAPVVLGAGMIALLVGGIALGGWLSYQAGKAMSPTTAGEKTWGWVGVPVGLFTGTLGLGIMGAVSNSK